MTLFLLYVVKSSMIWICVFFVCVCVTKIKVQSGSRAGSTSPVLGEQRDGCSGCNLESQCSAAL